MSVARRYEQSLAHYVRGTITYPESSVTIGTLPKGSRVLAVIVQITTAFDGTTPELTVGDGTTSDRFVAAGDVTETAVGGTIVANGVDDLSADTDIVVSFANATGDTTTGSANVTVLYAPDNG